MIMQMRWMEYSVRCGVLGSLVTPASVGRNDAVPIPPSPIFYLQFGRDQLLPIYIYIYDAHPLPQTPSPAGTPAKQTPKKSPAKTPTNQDVVGRIVGREGGGLLGVRGALSSDVTRPNGPFVRAPRLSRCCFTSRFFFGGYFPPSAAFECFAAGKIFERWTQRKKGLSGCGKTFFLQTFAIFFTAMAMFNVQCSLN